jgi:hypothetical protein
MVTISVFPPGSPCEFSLISVHGNYFDLSTMQKQVKFPAAGLSFIIYDDSSTPGLDDPASLLKLRRTGYIIDPEYPIHPLLKSNFLAFIFRELHQFS